MRSRVYTLDARNPERWVFFDFSRGSTVSGPGDLEWDLAVRRHLIVVNGGKAFPGRAGALDLGDVALDSLRVVPVQAYIGTERSLSHRPSHPVLEPWYRYNALTHLLLPRPTTFAIRTADGKYAALRILSYYCPGPLPGCLTFRYSYQGAGGRSLTP